MKDLLVAALAVTLLIGSWLVFFHYSEGHTDSYVSTIKKTILPAVEAGAWEDSEKELKQMSEDWHKYKKIALFFLDTEVINEIDYALARSVKYVKAQDVSNSAGELNAMIEQLKFLTSNEKITAQNIF